MLTRELGSGAFSVVKLGVHKVCLFVCCLSIIQSSGLNYELISSIGHGQPDSSKNYFKEKAH